MDRVHASSAVSPGTRLGHVFDASPCRCSYAYSFDHSTVYNPKRRMPRKAEKLLKRC